MLRRRTLTRGSPKNPNWRPSTWRSSSDRTAAESTRARPGDTGNLLVRVGRRDVRIETGRGRRHHVRRNRALSRAVVLHGAVDRLRDQRVGELGVGRSLVRARRRCRVIAVAGRRRTRMEVFRLREWLADQRAADHAPVDGHERAVRLAREEHLREAGHDARVYESCDDAEHERHEDGGAELFGHSCHPDASEANVGSIVRAAGPGPDS